MQTIEILITILCAGVMIGYTYGMDIPQALEVPLREPPYNLTTFQFNLLYVMMNIPIMLFDMPLGNLIDRLPVKPVMLCMLIICLIAQLIQALMFHYMPSSYFELILIARSFFGLVGDGLYTIQGIVLSKYCSGNYELMTSLVWSFGYLADSLGSFFSTVAYDSTHQVAVPLFIGTAVCGMALISGIGLIIVVKMHEKKKEKDKQIEGLIESILSKEDGSDKQGSSDEQLDQDRSILSDIKSLNKTFWIVFGAILLTECSCTNFIDNCNDLLVKRFGFTYLTAGRLGMIPYAGLTVLTIIFGKILSSNPKMRRIAYLISSSEFFLMTIILYFLPNTSQPTILHYIVVIVFLCSISSGMAVFFAGILTCVPIVAQKKVLGTAWGFIGMAIGMASTITPLIYSFVVNLDEHNLGQGYLNLTFTAIIISFFALILAIYIYFGPFGLLDLKYKEIQELKKNGKTLQQIIVQYSDI